ncbi:gamma-glutamyl-gamma-aminobutyrate hydrolase family protein [Thiocapsa rosea]|uniref:Putative glutamine amidotransferase n=1 Tax=Thiocapsa rosea TaxID=69360 RepID=A0A495VEG3_9GAMM|nr:type 1 glutamine amidotransferase [Thiocapsa rosea]RKT47210.1 putative glutamine amidotransferase [Thiocapsa rosea]
MARAPLIAITGPARGAFGPRLLVALAVRLYGGRPLQVRPGDAPKTLTYQGVVVTGGHDVEPVLYAAEPEVEPNYDRARDALETEVIRDALDRGLPLLGICRGAQLLNVCRGGSLFQDLHSHRCKTSHRWTVLPLKTLCVDDAASVIGRLLGTGRRRINSLHNQAIDRLGEGLRVSGRDLDGIVQAIEDPRADFLVGVQWHPEFLIYVSHQRTLFRALVGHARALA